MPDLAELIQRRIQLESNITNVMLANSKLEKEIYETRIKIARQRAKNLWLAKKLAKLYKLING